MTRKPSSETSDTDAHSRRARLVARRSRRTRIAVLVVVIAIAAAAAAGAWAANSNDPEAHAAGSDDSNGAANFAGGTFATPGVDKPAPPRSLDHANPLKLWIGGDSLAGLFGPPLGDQVGETGVVKTVIDYKTSSGLWSNDIRNWYQRATNQMELFHPEAVVFIIGTNDTPVVNGVDSNGDKVPDWEAEYRLKVGRMMDLLVGPTHRTVLWLGPPTLGTRSMDRGAKAMSQVMREEALKRSPDVEFLDTYELFSTSDGSYSRRILDEKGEEFTARIGDGVHFTTAGAEYLARAAFARLDARWGLLKQADLADPIGWNFVAGSGEVVPGYSSTPRPRYNQGQGQYSGTTAPQYSATTAPSPTTAATLAPTTVASTAPPATTPTTKAPPPTTPTTHTTPTTSS